MIAEIELALERVRYERSGNAPSSDWPGEVLAQVASLILYICSCSR